MDIILQLPLFIISFLIFYTVPGILTLHLLKQKGNGFEQLLVGSIIGFVLITMLSYLLFMMRIHVLLFVVIFGIFVYSVLLLKQKKLHFKFPLFKKIVLYQIVVVFLLGVIGQLLVIVPSGNIVNQELTFYSAHGHDVMWHVALAEQYKKGFPLQMPVFSGERLVNYHFFTDIPLADLSSYLPLNIFDLYLKFFPLLFSLFFGGIIFLMVYQLTKKTSAALWATIFSYGAGSFGFIITWINNQRIGGETIFGASQVQSSIGNPPQIAAFIIFLTFFYFFYKYLIEKQTSSLFIGAILAGSLVGFKVYGGVVLLLSLGFVALVQIIRERKLHILLACILGGVLSLLIFLPNAKSSGSFLIFEPWYFIRTMIVTSDRLNLLDWELRRQTYIYEHNWKRVVQLEVMGLGLFLLGNLGMRIIAILSLLRTKKKDFFNYYYLVFFFVIIISLTLPLLFVQKGVAGNAIQFIQYSLILLGILAGVTFSFFLQLFKNNYAFQIFLGALIIALMIPTQIGLLYEFYHKNPTSKIAPLELSALQFVEENTGDNAAFLLAPYNKYLETKEPIPPIWDWFDTAYFSALTGRASYLADTEQVDIMGYDREERTKKIALLFHEVVDPAQFQVLVSQLPIQYIYFPLAQQPKVDLTKTSYIKVFDNGYSQVWKVN